MARENNVHVETEKREKKVPKEFIKKIKNLGMNVEDAEILFKSKMKSIIKSQEKGKEMILPDDVR